MTPSPLSPPAPPPTPTPNPLLDTKPGRPVSVDDDEEEDGVAMEEEEEEEEVLAVEEVGRVREGAGSEGFTSVVKQGPNRFLQLPFFFFFIPSSPTPAAAPPIPGTELEGWGRL